jgi:hypothetical protein
MKGAKKGEVIREHTREDLMLTDPQEARTAQIRAEYLRKDPSPSHPGVMVGPADKLRMHILSVSLFPNLYNKKFLDKEMS